MTEKEQKNKDYFKLDGFSRILVFLIRWRALLPGWRLEAMYQCYEKGELAQKIN